MLSVLSKARVNISIRYAVLTLVCLAFWLYATFPYDALKRRIVSEASGAGFTVSVGSAGPGFLGVTLHNVRIQKPQDPTVSSSASSSKDAEWLVLPSVSVRPSVFPLGVAVRSNVLGGTIRGAYGAFGDLAVQLSFNDLDPSKGNFRGFTGLDLEGKARGDLSVVVPRDDAAREYDFSRAKGQLSVSTEKLTLRGGTLVVPMYGQPTPIDLPRVVIGNFNGRVVMDKGMATLENVKSQGEDLDLLASGTAKLNRRPEYSELNLLLKLKAQPEFVKRLGLLGAGISVMPTDRENPAFRDARITGYLGRPNFVPGL